MFLLGTAFPNKTKINLKLTIICSRYSYCFEEDRRKVFMKVNLSKIKENVIGPSPLSNDKQVRSKHSKLDKLSGSPFLSEVIKAVVTIKPSVENDAHAKKALTSLLVGIAKFCVVVRWRRTNLSNKGRYLSQKFQSTVSQ